MENQYITTESSMVEFVYTKMRETIIDPNEAAPTKPKIKHVIIHLFANTTTTTWVSDQQNNILQAGIHSRVDIKLVHLDKEQVTEPLPMYETIDMELRRWRSLPETERQQVIDKIFLSTDEMLKSISPKHNIALNVCCRIELKQDHIIHVSNEMDRIMQQSFEESVHKMVPASDSSIKALKRTIIVDGSCERCSICLEDFPTGCEVLCMPCCHAFHHDCIRKWLSSSHYCPNCRYEMPTN